MPMARRCEQREVVEYVEPLAHGTDLGRNCTGAGLVQAGEHTARVALRRLL